MHKVVSINRKEQIKSVAQNLFREKGFAGTSMRDLAKEVGVEAASLYSHIESKEDLLREICFRIAQDFFDAIANVSQLDLPADTKLEKAIVAHISVINRNLDASAVFFHEWRFLKEPYLTEFKHLRKMYEQHFREILLEGMVQQKFTNLNINIVLPALFSAMNWTYDWHKSADQFKPEEIGGEIFNMIFKGIRYS